MTSTTHTNTTDKELLDQHVAGDEEAFGALYERHYDRLRAVATGIVGNEAEDAVQDAMLTAYDKAGQFHGDSQVTTWLHRIVVNKALDIARRRKPSAELDQGVNEPAYEPWRIRQVMRRLDLEPHWEQLTHDQRECMTLVDIMGFSFAQASEILGVNDATLKTRCARGRAKLRGRLRAVGLR